jgi:hypothetical protein
MMQFGAPVIAYDCIYNREATDDEAVFFRNAVALRAAIDALTPARGRVVGNKLKRIARQRYTWGAVGDAYFSLLGKTTRGEVVAPALPEVSQLPGDSIPSNIELPAAPIRVRTLSADSTRVAQRIHMSWGPAIGGHVSRWSKNLRTSKAAKPPHS